MDFEEFCAAALSVYQLEALDRWEQHARCAYELFDKEGNRTIMIEELASVTIQLILVWKKWFNLTLTRKSEKLNPDNTNIVVSGTRAQPFSPSSCRSS